MVFTGGGGVREEVGVQVSGDSSDLLGSLDSAEAGLMSVSGAVTALGGALVGLAGVMAGKAVNAAREFEEQMVELEKVTDPQTAEEMGAAIQDMAERIPLAHRELSEIASQAGRLGIEGTDNIQEFTRVTAEMAVATDLAAADAADAFARITQLTGVPIENVEELGSAINELSNTMATTSSEITDSILRSGAAMSQLGLSAEDILGLSATLNEVSESSERAGTRLRRVAQEMLNPKKAENLAGALGMTAEEFRTMRDESPLQLIQQMAESFAEGGETADALRETLSTASRQAIAGLAQNLEGLDSALQTSNQQFEEGTSLSEEFQAANSTFNAELQRTRNRLQNVAIQTGEVLLPYLSDLLSEVNRGLTAFSKLNDETDGMAGTVAILGTAIAGIALVIGGLVSLLGGPVVLAIGAALAQVAALAAAWQTNFANIRGHTADAITRVEAILGRLGPAIEAAEGILNNLRVAWELVGDDVMTILSALLDGALGILTTLLDGFVSFVTALLQIINGDFSGAMDTLAGFFERTFTGILEFIGEWGDQLYAAMLRITAAAIEGAGTNLENFLSGLGVNVDLVSDELVSGIRETAARVEQQGAVSAAQQRAQEIKVAVGVDDERFDAYVDGRSQQNIDQYDDDTASAVRRGSYRGN